MNNILDKILKINRDIFGDNYNIEKINVGFTNTIYNVDNKYIIKICTNIENEENFKREIDFYNHNKNNSLIPKLYYYDITKENVSYLYEIIEKINGESLYNVWHKLSEEEREKIIKQLCSAMESIHSNKGESYDWNKYISNKFISIFNKAKKLLNEDELKKLEDAYNTFSSYLDSNEFVLIHNDLHFDNIFIYNGEIKIIDFERSIYAPKDFELDILYRMIRKPWKFASEETEKYTKEEDYLNIMKYIEKYYPTLIKTNYLYKRLAIYDIIYFLEQYVNYPQYDELKIDVLNAVNIVLNRE